MNHKPVVLEDKTDLRKLLELNRKLEIQVEQLQQRVGFARQLEKISSSEMKLGGILLSALETAIREFDFEMGGVYLFEENTEDLVLIAQNNFKDDFYSRVRENGSQVKRTLAARFKMGTVLSAKLPTSDILLNKFVKKESQIKSIVFAALRGREKLQGLLCVADRKLMKANLKGAEFLALLSRLLGLEIESFQLNNSLEELNTRHDLLLNNTLSGIFILQEQKFLYVNDRFARIHGYNKDEILKMDAARLEWPLDLQSARGQNISIKRKKSGDLHYECRGKDKDGNLLFLEMKAAFIEIKGKQAILGNVVDVTEQTQSQLELISSKERSHFLFTEPKEAIFLAYTESGKQGAKRPNALPVFLEGNEASLQDISSAWDEKSGWTFEYFKKNKSGSLNLLVLREMIKLTNENQAKFIIHDSRDSMIGILKSEVNTQNFEDYIIDTNQHLQAFVDRMPAELYFFDTNLNLIYANQFAQQGKKWSFSKNKDLHCSEIYPFCQNDDESGECEKCPLRIMLESGKTQQNIHQRSDKNSYLEHLFLIKQRDNQIKGVFSCISAISFENLVNQAQLVASSAKSQEKVTAILDSVNASIIALDEDGVIVFLNPAAEKLFGWKAEEALNSDVTVFYKNLNMVQQKIVKLMLLHSQKDSSQKIKNKIVTETNRNENIIHSMEWSFSKAVVRGKMMTFAFGRDITPHKKMEMELIIKNEFLESIIKFNPYGIEVFDSDGKMIHNNAASDLIYGYKGLVDYCLFDDLVFEEENVLSKIKKAFFGEIVTVGPFWYDTARAGYEGVPHRKVYVRITFAPIRSKDDEIYTIVAIHQDLTSNKEMEKELAATENRYREVVETAMDGIFRLDTAGVFTYANPVMVEILGHSLDELIGMPVKDLVPRSGLPKLVRLFDSGFQKAEAYKDELTILHRNGEELVLELSIVPILRDEEVAELQAICRNVTERKKAESALKASKEFYSILVEQSNDGVILIRPDGSLKFVNEGLCRLIGYERSELLNQKFTQYLSRKSKVIIAQLNRKRRKGLIPSNHFELEVIKQDSRILFAEVHLKIIHLNEVQMDMIHLRDITARCQAEEKIRILSTAVESSEDGVFITDNSGELIFVNKALAQMFGYTSKEWAEMPPKLLYDPHSLELLQNKIGPTALAGQNWTGELIGKRESGDTFPILQTVSPIFKEDGEQLGTVGICKDISEQKQIEITLRKNNQFLQKIIELNPYGVQIFDSDGNTMRVNRAFQKMFCQKKVADADLLFRDSGKNSLKKLLQTALEGKLTSDSPIWLSLKEINTEIDEEKANRLICVNAVLFPIVDEQKKVTNIVGLYEDITEREKYHDEIQRHNRELTALYDAGQAMVSIREPDMLIWSILRGATMAAGTEFGVFFSYSKSENKFRLSTTIGFTEDQLVQIYEKFKENVDGKSGTISWHGDFPNVLTPKDMRKATDIMSPEKIFKSTMWVPVVYEEDLLGVFNLFSKTPDAFSEDSIRLVTMFADQAAVALENVRLYSEVTRFAEKMEVKIAERTSELVASEAKFRSIVENSPDLISIENTKAQTLFGNPAFFQKLGYSANEVAQIGSLKLIHPEDLAAAKDAFDNLRNDQAIRNLECRYRRKDGSFLYLLLSAEKLKLGENAVYQFVGRDITEKKHLENTLKKSEVHHRALIDNVKDGVYTLKNNKIVWCNEQLATIFGYEKQELIGSYVARLFADQTYFLNYEQELYYALAQNGHHRSEFKGLKKSMEIFDLECSVSLIEQNGREDSEALVIIRDITNQKRMQEKLIQSERLAATGKLAASIAHEINNPLQGIMASLAAIKLKSPDEQNSGLNIIENGMKRIGNIVKQLLSLHRPEQQEKNWVDINQVVEEVSSLMQSQFSMNNIKIKKNLHKSLPKIWASSQQILQVLLNLLLNAQESITSKGEVRIFTRQKDKEILVTVKDSGKGIDSKEIHKIFDPFHSSKKKMGTGLGLSVVHSIIEAHRGRIEVHSELNKGAEFTIYLPIKPGN